MSMNGYFRWYMSLDALLIALSGACVLSGHDLAAIAYFIAAAFLFFAFCDQDWEKKS